SWLSCSSTAWSSPTATSRSAMCSRLPPTGRTALFASCGKTISNIPEEAYRYQLGARSAIEWIVDRYQVKTDKDSGIVNDPNDWSEDPRYIVDLLRRIVTVSLETMKVVDALPALDIIE
ncbi:MAG: type ISP restriction/modification enzyme, partial [Streptosporangiaceae bacterium]